MRKERNRIQKAEILAPAGSREALDAAWAAGADAVYFGLPLFGARAFAKNFTLEEAEQVIKEAHLAGKKVYITMNTLLEEEQMEQAADWAEKLYRMGADALIIQDLGLIHLLRHTLPELELHASTQLSVSTPYQIEQLKKLGIQRVVLAREATLEEIEACARTGMELEVFVHGALCISYSGQCRFSQVRYGRSGNKGACAQPCRMEYTLEKNGKPAAGAGRQNLQTSQPKGSFLLSPKDLSLLQDIPVLEKAGAASLKIEGRMKSPEYVYAAVTAARKAREGKKLNQQEIRELMLSFNRGYTIGHTLHQSGLDLVNPQISNHQGIPLGSVVSVKDGKAWIRLEEDLHQNDGIRFENRNGSTGQIANFIYDEKGKLTASMPKGSIAAVKLSEKTWPGSTVRKTSSFLQHKEVETAISKAHLQSPVTLHLICRKAGDPLVLEASDGTLTVSVTGPAAEKAGKQPATLASVEKQLKKSGSTWADVKRVEAEIAPDLFLPVSVLNALRREAIEKLGEAKTAPKEGKKLPYTWKPEKQTEISSWIEIMKPEQKQDSALPYVSEFPIPGTEKRGSLRHDEGDYSAHLGKGSIVEDLNVTNSYALAAVLEMGYEGALLSSELSEKGRKDLLDAFKARYGFQAPAAMTVYEKPRLMLMKHCPVNTALADGKRSGCSLCRQDQYALKGKDGRRALLYGSPECLMQIFDEETDNRIGQIPQLKEEGVEAFRMVLSVENAAESRIAEQEFETALSQK